MFPINMEPIRENPDVRYAAKYPIAESGISFEGIYQCDVYRKGILISGGVPEPPNTFTTEGIARMLNIMFHDISKTGAMIWYVGLFTNSVTPAVGNTAAACLGAAGTYGAIQATTEMDQTSYPLFTTVDTSTASITNSASKADFTLAATLTIYGAFLGSSSDPTDTSGYLMSAKAFSNSRDVQDNDEVSITYTISVTTS